MLDVKNSILLVVDLQERLLSAISNAENVLRQSSVLVQTAALLDIPIIISEQYKKGLGATASVLQQYVPSSAQYFEKTAFGCGADTAILAAVQSLKRTQVVVCGVEAHVCVSQTAQQLKALGYELYLAEDAVASRSERNYQTALRRLYQIGVLPSSVEMTLFEWLRDAKHPQFKAVQALIK